MPILIPAMLVIVLLFVGAFGGRVGKIIAIVGIIIMFLWYIGVPGYVEPLRHYAKQAVAILEVRQHG